MLYPHVSSTPYINNRAGYPQPQAFPQQVPMQQQEPNVICRPVASIDEAMSIPTDFNGNLMVFPDLSHGMIYTKQLNYLKTYVLKDPEPAPIQETPVPIVNFAPMSEVEGLKQEVAQLKAQLETLSTVPDVSDKPRASTRGGTEK